MQPIPFSSNRIWWQNEILKARKSELMKPNAQYTCCVPVPMPQSCNSKRRWWWWWWWCRLYTIFVNIMLQLWTGMRRNYALPMEYVFQICLDWIRESICQISRLHTHTFSILRTTHFVYGPSRKLPLRWHHFGLSWNSISQQTNKKLI